MNPFISMRLMDHHLNDQLMEDLLAVIDRHRESVDEVWFASEYGFPELGKIEKSSMKMMEAAKKIRSRGIVASLQISNSIGHGDYLRYMDFNGLKWSNMMGPDGTICEYINCPTDPQFLHYIQESTRLYSRFQPDIIWIDDDLRMSNHGTVDFGCFCDCCMNIFNRKHDVHFTREELWRYINEDGDPSWRERYIAYNEVRLANVTRAIMSGCLAASPNTIGALQHAGSDGTLYNGRTLHAIYDVMLEMTGKPPMSRPGGGFYYDASPRGMLDKALSIDYQNCCLPEYISHSRPEVENLPHLALGKTAHGTCVESTLYLAYGCDGLSFASMMMDNDHPAVHETLLARLVAWKPYWQLLVHINKGTAVGGLQIPRGLEIQKQRKGVKKEERFWDSPGTRGLPQMTVVGLPVHWENGIDAPYILYPSIVDGLSDAELTAIFAKGVLTCGESIHKLNKRGLTALAGMVSEPLAVPCYGEHYLDTEFTTGVDIRPGSGFTTIPTGLVVGRAYRLIPMPGPVTEVARYHSHDGRDMGLSAAVVENALGGRTAVIGYYMWENQVNVGRRTELIKMADYVSRGKLPAFITTICQAVVVPRVEKDNTLRSVTIFNACIDWTDSLEVCVGNPAKGVPLLLRPCEGDMRLPVADGMIHIPPIAPWSCATIAWMR